MSESGIDAGLGGALLGLAIFILLPNIPLWRRIAASALFVVSIAFMIAAYQHA